jgi:biopolymer transport protein ExbD
VQVGNGDSGSKGSPLAGSAISMLMARKGASTTHTLSEINVTPFVDVVLVLLIIFMITAPMLMRSMDVSLPSATLRRDSPSERTIVTLDAQGRTFVNDRAINIELLEDEIKQRVEVQNLRVAYLRADETLQYREIIRIMDLLKRAGVDTVGLAYVYPEEKTN